MGKRGKGQIFRRTKTKKKEGATSGHCTSPGETHQDGKSRQIIPNSSIRFFVLVALSIYIGPINQVTETHGKILDHSICPREKLYVQRGLAGLADVLL